jgi:hypothetical protein
MGVMIALAAMTAAILVLLWRVVTWSAALDKADYAIKNAKYDRGVYYEAYVDLLSDVADKQKRIEELEKELAKVSENRAYWQTTFKKADMRMQRFLSLTMDMNDACKEANKPY